MTKIAYRALLAIVAFCSFATSLRAQAPSIQPLGWLDSGVRQSIATGVSLDGTAVVGHSRSPTGYDRAFLWTAAGGMQELGTISNMPGNSYAAGVRVYGSAMQVVGHSASPLGFSNAFEWNPSTGMLGRKGFETYGESFVYNIALNGNAYRSVGSSQRADGLLYPAIWRGTQLVTLAYNAPGAAKGACDVNGGEGGGGEASVGIGTVLVTGFHTPSEIAAGQMFVAFKGNSLVMPRTEQGGGYDIESSAEAANRIGDLFAGYSRSLSEGTYAARLWGPPTPSTYLHRAPNGVPISNVNSYAYDVSHDAIRNGRYVAVGEVAAISATRGDAYIWHAGHLQSPQGFLRDILENEYGVDMTKWGRLYRATRCSADGKVIVGYGEYDGATTAFRILLPLGNDRPRVTSSTLTQGQTYVVPLGTSFSATVRGQDGDPVTMRAVGTPPSAILTPSSGTTGASPLNVTLALTPTLADVGTHDVTIAFADQAYAGNPGSISFKLTVPPNNLPTATAPNAETVECDGDLMVVELSTTVSDADDHPLTVVWKVNGKVEQTTPNVAAGSTVAFEHAYGDGANAVTVEVNDGFETGTASTTVTVEDTTAPVVVVAENLQVPTNPGKNFATGVTLTPPSVTDLCDGEPTLTNNAPSQYPLGETTVTWTATDADGNQATATQKVAVVDQEKPKLAAPAAIRRFVDPGKLLSTARLTPPAATDNVPAGLKVTSNAPTSFRLGLTVVTWTAKDAAGNTATAKQNVTVVNRAPKANAGKAIVVATTSEKGATATLNGSASSDPDKHVLKYRWAAPGVSLKGPTTAKPSGIFPIGTKTVTLTVTDPAGAKSTAKVTVTVKLQNAKKRARGKQANEAFAKTFHHGTRDAVNSAPNAKSLAGYTYANAAQRIAIYAGDHVQWNEGQSHADATLEYAELRALQSLCGERAAAAYLDAYAETGDEDALHAGLWALNGAAYAEADVAGR